MALTDLLTNPNSYNLGNGGPSKGITYIPNQNSYQFNKRVEWDITDPNANPTFLIGQDHKNPGIIDGLILRGGITTNIDRREIDIRRITNFLQSPTGDQFLIRQAALQLLNTQPNQRVFNAGVSLIAQIAASGLSNFKRTGLLATPVDSKGLNVDINLPFGLGTIGLGGDYVSTFSNDEKLTTNFNLGDPGADIPLTGLAKLADTILGIKKSKNPKDYAAGNIKDNFTKLDKINLLDVVRSGPDGELPDEAAYYAKDMVNFRFEVIDQDNIGETDYIIFRAFIDSYSDDFSANHNTVKYNGRAEEFYTYNSFKRSISVSFKIAAQSRHDMYPLYRKLNYLAAQTAPSYSSSGRIRTPYMKLTMGDYFNKLPGVLTNLSVGWQKDYVWEIALDKFQKGTATDEETGETSPTLIENTNAKDKHMLVLPHVLDVTINYLPIHTFTPSNDFRNPFLGIEYWLSKNRQSAGSEALNHDFFLNMPTFNKIETKKAGPIENKIERPPLQKATLVDDSIGDAVSPTDPNTIV